MRVPKYGYGDFVVVIPLERVSARVLDVHYYGAMDANEYDVRYFHEGKDYKIRVFEDELDLDNRKEYDNAELRAHRANLRGQPEQAPSGKS